MEKIIDYYTYALFEFPSREEWQFGKTVDMSINEMAVRVFFSKGNEDINGGSYEVVKEGVYSYYDFFESEQEIANVATEYGIDFLPDIIFTFMKGLKTSGNDINKSDEDRYIVYLVRK